MCIRFTYQIIISFLVFGIYAELKGQSRKYTYEHLTEQEGLAQDFVYGLVQDDRGFLWAGTGNGLSRYDGFEIKNFSKENGLSGNFVTEAFQSKNGNLFFGHNYGGVSVYDGLHFTALIADTVGTKVVSIADDAEGDVWIGTQSKGLIKIDKDSFNISHLHPKILEEKIINVIAITDNLLWIGTNDGLIIFQINANVLTPIEKSFLLSGSEVTAITPDKKNKRHCWVGTAFSGIHLFGPDKENRVAGTILKVNDPDLSDEIIGSIDQNESGDLWIGTQNHGAFHLNISTDGKSILRIESFEKNTGFPFTAVNTLIIDRQDQVWASTMGNGLVKIYRQAYTYFPLASRFRVNDVRAIAETHIGYLIATDIGLMRIKFDQESDEYVVEKTGLLRGESILSIFTDSKKNTWIGTENKGVFIFTEENDTIHPVTIRSGTAEPIKVRLFEEDKNGNIWLSAIANGVYVIDENKKLLKHLSTSNRFIHNDIFSIKADTKGNIWFGAHSTGLARMNAKGDLHLFSKDGVLKSRDINDIDEDIDGNIWIATEGDGFFKYADKVFTQVGNTNNLASPFIKGIKFDPEGRVWYSYRKGISYLDLKSGKKRNFTEKDGLISNEVYSSSILIDSKSNKWFCNDDGVTLFENDPAINKKKELETYITGIRIFFKDFDASPQNASKANIVKNTTAALTLSHEQNHITFDFVAINLNRSGKIYYRHFLKGYDFEWTPPESVNFITYTNLDPGNYVLQVQATDDLESWVDPITEYSFIIERPFWKRTWFYLLQIVSVISLFSLTYFLGKQGTAKKRLVVRIMLFTCFFITLEYVENFIDPLISGFFEGAPVFRFFLNFLLALLLFPVEALISHWLDIDKRLPKADTKNEGPESKRPIEMEKLEIEE